MRIGIHEIPVIWLDALAAKLHWDFALMIYSTF